MKLYKLLLLIMSVNFILQGCITKSYKRKMEKKYNPAYEFLKPEEISSNEILGLEGRVGIFEGVYLGEMKKNGINYFNLQFTGMLNGKNRILDIYIDTSGKTFPLTHEFKEIKSGKPAFLFLDYGCCFKEPKNVLEYLFAEFYGDYSDPDIFLNFINYDKSKLSDTIFFVGLNYDNSAYPKSIMVTNIYSKNSEDGFSAKRITSKRTEAYYNLKLNYIIRNKGKMRLSKMMYGLTVLGDIVTSPIQLLGYIYLRIFGIW